jgi:YihY family inner membrane protein
MEALKRPLIKLDKLQQKIKPVAFIAAVFKKYSDDEGGHLAALITYYGFLSLFPLLLVATLLEGINTYFPALSQNLQESISGFHRSGLALMLGVLATIYGARGGASTLRYSLNKIWRVPPEHRINFPLSIAHSLFVVFVGGVGFVTAAVLSSYAAGLTDVGAYRLVPFITSLLILIAVFYLIFTLTVNSRDATRKDLFISALLAAIGVQILQSIGGYLLTHQLQSLSAVYGTFAVVLGLLFWIYLQAQVLMLAAFAGVVYAKRLWPVRLL